MLDTPSPAHAGTADGARRAAPAANPPASDGPAQADMAVTLLRAGREREAMPWMERAAAAGDPRGMYLLGVALHNGDAAPHDRRRARILLERAAAAGIAPAREALAAIGRAPAPTLPATAMPAAVPVMPFVEALLRPLLAERLELLLPAAIQRAVAAAGA